LTEVQQVNIDTPFGKPSDAITIGKLDGVGIAFCPGTAAGISFPRLSCRSAPIFTR